VTHALLCSAEGVNRFHPEIGFFRGAVNAYIIGRHVWQKETSAFFADPAHFRRLMRETAETWLDQVWDAVDRPRILCVKDPNLTPHFPTVAEMLPDALFVVVCRHPHDVVRSRQAVLEQMGHAVTPGDVTEVAREYLQYYSSALEHRYGGRMFAFRYEDLNKASLRDALAGFLNVPGFDTSAMWQVGGRHPAAVDSDPWRSPKYFRPLDLERRLDPLPEPWRAIVDEICEPIMLKFRYLQPAPAPQDVNPHRAGASAG